MTIALQYLSLENPIAGPRPAILRRLRTPFSRGRRFIVMPANYPQAPMEIHTIADLQMGSGVYIVRTPVDEPQFISDIRALREEERASEALLGRSHTGDQEVEHLAIVWNGKRHSRVALALRARQHDPRALRQPRRAASPTRPPLKRLTL